MNILVIGAGKFQNSGICKLKEKKHTVIAVDGDPNAEGKLYADYFFNIDINDPELILETLDNEKLHIDSAMCFVTEAGLRSVAYINSKRNLVGLTDDQVFIATNKALQREIMQKAGLPVPFFQKIAKDTFSVGLIDDIRCPVIIKPTDNAGSRGVYKVNSKEELLNKINQSFSFSKHDAEIIIEEFIPGVEFTVEAIIIDSEISILGISEKRKPINNFTVSIELFYNSPFVEKHRTEIEKLIKDFLTACKFDNTITHTEIIYSYKDHKFYIVETTTRSGGFYIFDKILPYITGQDIVGITIDSLLNLRPVINAIPKKSAILGFFYGNLGKIHHIEILESLIPPSDKYEYGLFVKTGDIVDDLDSDSARFGFYISNGETWKETYYYARLLEYSVKFEIV